MKHIGKEVDNILFQRGLKKKDFADMLGMSDVNLSKVLKKSSVDAQLLEKIAINLQVPVSSFFDDAVAGSVAGGAGKESGNDGNDARVWAIVEAQQKQLDAQSRMLEKQLEIIETLSQKGGARVAGGVAAGAVSG